MCGNIAQNQQKTPERGSEADDPDLGRAPDLVEVKRRVGLARERGGPHVRERAGPDTLRAPDVGHRIPREVLVAGRHNGRHGAHVAAASHGGLVALARDHDDEGDEDDEERDERRDHGEQPARGGPDLEVLPHDVGGLGGFEDVQRLALEQRVV
eukprot:1276157-Rhodomonas_salina.1